MSLFEKKETTSNKVGRVRKCPQCGAAVPSSKVICPECGWEFDDVNNNQSAVQRLAAELSKAHGRIFFGKTEKEIIEEFPIPKSKADLLELTIYFKSNLLHKQDTKVDPLYRIYKTKYEECIMKAKQFYRNDTDFRNIIAEYEQEKKNQRLYKVSAIVFACLAIVGGIVWYIIYQ